MHVVVHWLLLLSLEDMLANYCIQLSTLVMLVIHVHDHAIIPSGIVISYRALLCLTHSGFPFWFAR